MLIRMKTTSAGPSGSRESGRVYDVEDVEAGQLIAGGYAVEEKGPPPAIDDEEDDGFVTPAEKGQVTKLSKALDAAKADNEAKDLKITELETRVAELELAAATATSEAEQQQAEEALAAASEDASKTETPAEPEAPKAEEAVAPAPENATAKPQRGKK